MHERLGWLSPTLWVEPCWGSAFLPQRLRPASAVQEERALQRAVGGVCSRLAWMQEGPGGCERGGKEQGSVCPYFLQGAGTGPWENT